MDAEETINQRLTNVRISLNLSQDEVADAIEKKRSAISKIENGQQNVPNVLLEFYKRKHNVSIDWLLSGEGEMFRNNQAKGGQHAQAGRDIGVQAGRDVTQHGSNSDLKMQLEAALMRINDLEARIKDKEEMIEFLKQQKKG